MYMNGWISDTWDSIKSFASDFATFPAKVQGRLRNVSPDGSLYDYVTSSKGLVSDVLRGAGFKGARLKEFADQMKQTQDTLDLMYSRVQTYKKYPAAAAAANVNVAALQKTQQEGYVRFQYMNFWGQMVPYIHVALKSAGVRPADYVNANDNSPLVRSFSFWSGIDKDFQKYKDSGQLAGLGLAPAAIAAIAVAAIALGWIAFEAWRQLALTWRNAQDKEAQKPLVDCVAAGGPNAEQCANALREMGVQATQRERDDRKGTGDLFGDLQGILIGVAVIGAGIIFLPTLLEAGKTGAKAIRERREQTAGLGRGLRGAQSDFAAKRYEELRQELRALTVQRPGFNPRVLGQYERVLRKMEKLRREMRKAR